MKIRRETFPNDPCMGSMNFLKERIEVFFNQYVPESTQRYYPELDIYKNQFYNADTVLDVVVFGNNVKSFFQSGLWPARNYRIWTLSPAHQKFWTSVLMPNDSTPINLIPRSLITYTNEFDNKEINFSDSIDLVFSGRLSAQKNITFLLLLYKELEVLGLPIKLHLYGRFDDQYDEIFGRRIHENYKETVINLIRKLDFDNPPLINENLNANEWTDTGLKNPVLISLSTYHCEDFGVSITQAQEKGWPLILTDMLGHQAVEHDQVILIPSQYHLREHLSLDLKRIFAKDLASRLKDSIFLSIKKTDPKIEKNIVKDVEILNAKKDIISLRGTNMSLIDSENVGLFYDTQTGLRFYLDFIQSIYPLKNLVIFIVEDADHKGIPLNVQNKLQDALKDDSFYPYFISLKHLFKSKVEIDLLAQAEKVVLLLDKSIREATYIKLINVLSISKDKIY